MLAVVPRLFAKGFLSGGIVFGFGCGFGQPSGEDFVDAVAVHIDHFEAPTGVVEMVAGVRDPAKVGHHKATGGLVFGGIFVGQFVEAE